MTHPRNRELRRAIYALKREHGQAITLCRTVNNDTNFTTGRNSEDLVRINIRRAIFLPARAFRDFAYDLSFIAANKNFTYGGFFDKKLRRVLVDRRDIVREAADWPVDQNMHVVHKGLRWEVKEFFEYEDEECIFMLLERLVGTPLMDQTSAGASESLTLTEDADGEVAP